jgi:hypothetical protein
MGCWLCADVIVTSSTVEPPSTATEEQQEEDRRAFFAGGEFADFLLLFDCTIKVPLSSSAEGTFASDIELVCALPKRIRYTRFSNVALNRVAGS